jgi:hypothetical protein
MLGYAAEVAASTPHRHSTFHTTYPPRPGRVVRRTRGVTAAIQASSNPAQFFDTAKKSGHDEKWKVTLWRPFYASVRRADMRSDSLRMAASMGRVMRSPLLRSLISTSPALMPLGPTIN